MAAISSFLGRGWSFPPTFDKSGRQVIMLEGEQDIESSLQILLSTALGERIMQPKYGCNMDDMVFENLDITLKTEIKNRMQTAILFYEPRIELHSIDIVTADPAERVLLTVEYTVRTTNTRYNLVFPFYKTEGANK
jgi:phage baseplate assembly protein W